MRTPGRQQSRADRSVATPSHAGTLDVSSQPLAAEPIAIVGIGCRFPGADGPDAFWELLRDGVDAIGEVPPDRFDIDAYYDPRPGTPGKIATRGGGFLRDINGFDAAFFGISPREATEMDPQQRLLLEVAWEALEDGGQVPAELPIHETGVYVGAIYSEYEDLVFEDLAAVNVYALVGNTRSVLAGRVAYALGLQGPTVMVDTACSSSMTAVHLACQSLRSGECQVALAAGVNLVIEPKYSVGFSNAGMLAPDGRCKSFDRRADGFVRSDGVGVIVLKPLAAARAAGDRIYALIRGSAINSDGRSGGLMITPSPHGQEAVIRAAYRSAGITPAEVSYVEAHGTGTSVGDPVEARALGAVLAEGHTHDRPVPIGSVKSNIGHTEGAAGIAAIIKTALVLHHKQIPPSLHCDEPNPAIPWDHLPLRVQRALAPFPESERPRIASVSSFGISGTNAHLVLQEAPPPVAGASPGDAACDTAEEGEEGEEPALLPFSAHSPEALRAQVGVFHDWLAREDGSTASLRDLATTASLRRTHHDHRLSVVARSRAEAVDALDAVMRDEAYPGVASGRRIADHVRKVVFVFPGQGGQWLGMGRQLMRQEPVFRAEMEACDRAMRRYVSWSLLAELTADENVARLGEIDIVQPAIFAVQASLAALWRSWGIEPAAVVGHSMGEVAAAYVAGALTLDDAARVICLRSQLLRRTSGGGAMAVVHLAQDDAATLLRGYEDRVSIAALNGPTLTVLSGDPAALAEILRTLERRAIFGQMVRVDVASHSPQMDPLRPELLRLLGEMRPRRAAVPLYSTVTDAVSDGSDLDAAYWVRNLRQPVLLLPALRRLLDDGHDAFVELSPHPTLIAAIQQTVDEAGTHDARVLSSLRRAQEERAVLLESLGALYTLGCPVRWGVVAPGEGRCVALPAYPWQHERFWLEERSPNGAAPQPAGQSWRDSRAVASGHPFLPRHTESAAQPGTHTWECAVGLDCFPYLSDHRVQGKAVLPGAAYVELARAGAAASFPNRRPVLERVSFRRALFLAEADTYAVQLALTPSGADALTFQVFSRATAADAAMASGGWMEHAAGQIRLEPALSDAAASEVEHGDAPAHPRDLAAIQSRCSDATTASDYYTTLREQGLEYGPTFQGIETIWRREGEALARIQLPTALATDATHYGVHPALLDACFQTIAATLPDGATGSGGAGIFLPVAIERFAVASTPPVDQPVWCHAVLRTDDSAGSSDKALYCGDIALLDTAGHEVFAAHGLAIQELGRDLASAASPRVADWFYALDWRELPPVTNTPDATLGSWLLFVDQSGVGLRLKAELEARGQQVTVVAHADVYRALGARAFALDPAQPADYRRLLKETLAPNLPPCRGVVHLWALDAPDPSAAGLETGLDIGLGALAQAEALGPASVLALVQALAGAGAAVHPRLWLVTAGTQTARAGEAASAGGSLGQAPLLGLGRVLAYEHPELRCGRVDLSALPAADEVRALAAELLADGREDELALRGGARYGARMAHATLAAEIDAPVGEVEPVAIGPHDPFHVEIATPGILDHLVLRAISRGRPGPGEIEIQVRAAGLNFPDVMQAMGVYPGQAAGPLALGVECAGIVSAVGPGVEGFQPGDAVMAVARGAFGRFAVAPAAYVLPKPVAWSFAEAATAPIAYLTAYYGLHHLARLGASERVLIHSAASGVGLAAVHLARRAGAEIFATAGTAAKRAFLATLGVHHVMDSRSLAFADEVMERTAGRGVDVVLNSLAGEGLFKSLSVLAPYGRFVEMGKRDIYEDNPLGLSAFQKNRALFAIDMDGLARDCETVLGTLLRDLSREFETGSLKPLPAQSFPIGNVVNAFRTMIEGKHIGKILVTLDDEPLAVLPAANETPATLFRSDATYLITGGLGGLGLTLARWLVDNGARALALTGRRPPSAAAEAVVDELRAAGATVRVIQADVAREDEVRALLAQMDAALPPLRGVFHAAGLLDDGIALQLDRQRLRKVMAPKVDGAWNLHRLTRDHPLDYFVLFSSAASLIGSPGQGNYAAANAFLDALAHARHAQGLPALAVNWGPWAEVGLAVRPDRGGRLAQRGIASFSPAQGLEALALLLRQPEPQMGVMPLNLAQWMRFYPMARELPAFAELRQASGAMPPMASAAAQGEQRAPVRSTLFAASAAERPGMVEAYLAEQVAKVLRLARARLDTHQSLSALGLDSLMAVELKNRIEADLAVTVPVTDLLQGPSIVGLAAQMMAQFAEPDASAVVASPVPSVGYGAPIAPLTTETGASPADAHSVEGAHISPSDRAEAGSPERERSPIIEATLAGAPLSYGQRALWFLHQLAPESAAYNVPSAIRLRGALDVAALRRAFQTLLERHAILRTTYRTGAAGEPEQVTHPHVTLSFAEEDAAGCSDDMVEARLVDEAHHPFDLARGPLLRVRLFRSDAATHVLAITAHHIAIDFLSLLLLTQELRELYLAARAGRPANLPPGDGEGAPYAAYVRWQREMLASSRGAALGAHWLAALDGAPHTLALPTDHPRPRVQTYRGHSHGFQVDERLTSALRRVARTSGATLYMTLLAAFQAYLARRSGQDDLLVGSPMAGRTRAEFDRVVGYLVNPVVLRARVADDPSFSAFLAQVRQTVLAALEHQEYPFPLLVEQLAHGAASPDRSPLFQAMFSLENPSRHQELSQLVLGGAGARVFWGDLELDSMTVEQRASQFDLTLTVIDGGATLAATLDGNSDLFEADTLARMAAEFQSLLAGALADPNQPLSRLPLVPASERERLLRLGRPNARSATESDDLPAGGLPAGGLPALFEAQAARTPEAVAVMDDSGATLTYAALNRRANQLAHQLRSWGVGPDVLVGLCAERSFEWNIAVLAILKAGGAFVPLDPAVPDARLAYVLADTGAQVLLTQEHLRSRFTHFTGRTLCLDSEWVRLARRSGHNPHSTVRPTDLAYVIYTSGSTGAPKGVLIEHRSICHRLRWGQESSALARGDTMLALTSPAFDVAVLELFRPLIAGARLLLARPGGQQDSAYLAHLVSAEHVTHLDVVPSLLRLLVEEPELVAAPALREITCGGEALSLALVRRVAARLDPRRVALYNRYGPTEATIDVSYHRVAFDAALQVEGDNPVGNVPIGRPIAGAELYVLDAHNEPVPIGVAGELCIGDATGHILARGYHHRPDLTAARFVSHPFSDAPGARLYRTGDRARWQADGTLEYLGRDDRQVKLRGYRIELGEIEAALARQPGVQAALAALRGADDTPRLVAYVVMEGSDESIFDSSAGDSATAEALMRALERELPAYMVPASVVLLPSFPLLPSGKVDLAALPTPEWTARARQESAFVAPSTRLETRLAAIWSAVLEAPRVGIHDDFAALGGHSLQAAQLVFQVRAECAVDLPLRAFFEAPTIAGMAQTIERIRGGADASAAPALDLRAEAVLAADIVPSPDYVSLDDPPRDVLLTGATGFLGAFLLAELLEQTAANVHCLVRAGDRAEGHARIRRRLQEYALWRPTYAGRIIPVLGDLALPRLGLSTEEFARLADEVQAIYHSGALVNFVYPYHDLKPANVNGTQEMLRLACAGRTKPVHAVSTLSVFAHVRDAATGRIREDEPLEGHAVDLRIGYSQSKWVAEQLLARARERGVPVAIYRPGSITGDSRTGAWSADEFLCRAIKGSIQVGAMPATDAELDMTPVDFVSRAIVALSCRPASLGQVFHLINPIGLRLRGLVAYLRQAGYALRPTTFAAWRAALVADRSPDNALYPMLPLLLDGEIEEQLLLAPEVFATQHTQAGLAGTDITCPPLDSALLDTYLTAMMRSGFLPPPLSRAATNGALEHDRALVGELVRVSANGHAEGQHDAVNASLDTPVTGNEHNRHDRNGRNRNGHHANGSH